MGLLLWIVSGIVRSRQSSVTPSFFRHKLTTMPERIARSERVPHMRILWPVLLQIVGAALAFMLVARSTQPSWLEAFAVGVFVAVTLIVTVGAFWMMWAAFRHDHPIPKVFLAAFVPCAFVWYYFERANQFERGHLMRVVRISLSAIAMIAIVVVIAPRILGS